MALRTAQEAGAASQAQVWCRYGGLYIDIDMESIKPVDELLQSSQVVLAAIGNNRSHEHSVNK